VVGKKVGEDSESKAGNFSSVGSRKEESEKQGKNKNFVLTRGRGPGRKKTREVMIGDSPSTIYLTGNKKLKKSLTKKLPNTRGRV